MPRKKNSTFVGITPFDVDVDAVTLQHTIENAVGNTALVYDMLTGENGEANTIRHIGGGRGCPLGVPLWQQYIGRSLNYIGTGSVKGGVPAAVWLCAQPFFLPEGETEFVVQVRASGTFDTVNPAVRITSETGTTLFGPATLQLIDSRNAVDTYEVRVTGLTTGLMLVFLEADTTGASASNIELVSWHGFFPRQRPSGAVPARVDLGTNVQVATPSATEGVAHTNFQDTMFYFDGGIDGYTATYLDLNLNGLEEFGGGWPAGGNSSYTHVDHDGAGAPDASNPARSRFHAGTRALYANEPEFDFPWVSAALGAISVSGAPVVDVTPTPPASGLLSWFAPYVQTAAAVIIHRAILRAPDFQTSSSRLKWAVLAMGEPVSGTDDITDWQVNLDTGAGASGATAFGARFAVGGSPTWLGLAKGSALAFSPDAIQTLTIETTKAIAFGATGTEFFALGFCLYWEP